MTSDMIEPSVTRAIEYLYQSQLPYGEFAIYASNSRDLNECHLDSSPSATAFVLNSMQFVGHPKVIEIRRKALNFLVEEMEGPGVWRFWSSRNQKNIDADLDDTCYISSILRKHHPHIFFGSNLAIIINNKNENGLFHTWIRGDRAKNDVDSVVNANVLSYLGEREETRAACDHLNHLVSNDREDGSYWYYLDNLSLYYAMSRACFHGVASLAESREVITSKVVSRQRADGSFGDDLNTAYAVCTLINFQYPDNTVLNRAIQHMLNRQMESGAWAKVAAFTGPEPPRPHSFWWGSDELTTAISIEALARYRSPIKSE